MSVSRSFAQRKTNSFVARASTPMYNMAAVKAALPATATDLCGVYVFPTNASVVTFQGALVGSATGAVGETLQDMGVQFTVKVAGKNDFATYRLVRRADYTNPSNTTVVGGAVGYVLVENNFSAAYPVTVSRV